MEIIKEILYEGEGAVEANVEAVKANVEAVKANVNAKVKTNTKAKTEAAVKVNDILMQSCSFSGHRPGRLAFGFDESDERCMKLKAVMREQIEALVSAGVTMFYSGMALGVDQWAAEIVLDLKKTHPKLKLIAVRPCETQADGWTVAQHERHFATLALCDDVFTIQPRYSQGVMHKRNKFLVDHAEHLLAVYDGGSAGGTAFTVKYAKEQKRSITVIHPDTLEVTQL